MGDNRVECTYVALFPCGIIFEFFTHGHINVPQARFGTRRASGEREGPRETQGSLLHGLNETSSWGRIVGHNAAVTHWLSPKKYGLESAFPCK